MIVFRRPILSLVLLAACEMETSGWPDGRIEPEPDAEVGVDSGVVGPDAESPPQRCLSYSPASYFHDVTLGRTELLRFTIRNTCREARRIMSARIVGDDEAFALDPLPLPHTLELEELLRIPVRFSPLEPRSYEAQVAIEIDDPDQPEFRVRVLGEGVGGELRALPSRLELDGAPIGCRTASRSLALWNEGPGPMYVFSVALEGPDAASFSFRPAASLPRDIPAHDGLRVELDFEASKAGVHEATLLVTYNGRQSPARVPLSALGVTERRREEPVRLEAKPVHDLVFLVPPTSFQRGEAEALAAFLEQVRERSEIDLRVLITPSGARDAVLGAPVACPGFPSILDLTRVEPELLEVLVPCMISVARNEAEARSSAVMTALIERSFLQPTSEDVLLRSTASVHFVFSTFLDGSKVPLPFVIGFLDALPRTTPQALRVHGYDYPAPGQPSLDGARQYAIIERTGGLFVEQRSEAWPRFFERLWTELENGPRPVVPKLAPRVESVRLFDLTSGATVSYALEDEGRRLWVSAGASQELVLAYEARCGR